MSLVTFNHEDAMGADNGGGGMTKGGVYGGTIKTCKVIKTDYDSRVNLEFCIENTVRFDGNGWVKEASTNNKMRIQIVTKEGKSMYGADKIKALLGMNSLQGTQEQQMQDSEGKVFTYVVNLHGVKVAYSCFRKDRWYEDKLNGRPTGQMKLAYDFDHLHFFDPATLKTYSETVNKSEPKAILRPIQDELLDPTKPPVAPSTLAPQQGGGFPGGGFGGASAAPVGGNPFGGTTVAPNTTGAFGGQPSMTQQQVAHGDAMNYAFITGMQNATAPGGVFG